MQYLRSCGIPVRRRLPGPMPFELRKYQIPHVLDHWITVKHDGTRGLLCQTSTRTVWIDRSMAERDLEWEPLATYGVLDGEMMDDGTFIVHDCLAINGESVMKENLRERLVHAARVVGTHSKVRVKRFYRVDEIDEIEADGPNDGVILTNPNGHYNSKVYKIKSEGEHTVDFMVDRGQLFIQTRKGLEAVGTMESCYPNGSIVECALRDGEWVPIRLRGDKRRPNFIAVMMDALISMCNPLSLHDLRLKRCRD